MRAVMGVLAAAAVAAATCTHDFANASFDLSKLRVPHGTYIVKDNRDNINATISPIDPAYDAYIYMFNVCDDVEEDAFPVPEMWDKCAVTSGSSTSGIPSRQSGPAAAFQYTSATNVPDKHRCHRLSGDVVSHPGNETWSLVEPANPSRGVQVRYEGGDLCCPNGLDACENPIARSLELQFFCNDDSANIFDKETVLEYDSCKYQIWLYSSSGCPVQCPIVNNKLCAGHGVCDFDTGLKAPRCFCNDGFTGDKCDTPVATQQGLSLAGVVVIVVSVLLVLLLGVLYFLWNKIRSLRLDPNAYKSLTGGPEADAGGIYDD